MTVGILMRVVELHPEILEIKEDQYHSMMNGSPNGGSRGSPTAASDAAPL
jgi:hypothetical protein